jgi:transcriptional regulator with XRE-family HTH domain
MAVDQDVSRVEYARVNFQERFGANLKRLRKAAGLSQEDLMKIADVHRTQISKYERGQSEPQAEVLAKLSRAIGVSAEEFFAGVGWEEDPPRLVIEPAALEGNGA